MQFRFDKGAASFELTILANDPTGKPVEVTLRDDMAIAISDSIMFAIEQNEIRSARIAAGMRVIDEPEIRTYPSSESSH
ncbi:MAG TPA: hypothetical protein VMF58_16045 [Rhizomicrobium sp.]|nr:hypothetical protein [Rhizomicrobium sp.]